MASLREGGKLSKLDQKKLQQDIKTLTKKATGLVQRMNDRLKDLRDKNYRIAQEQQFIALQPAWLAAEQPSVPLLPPPVADSADGRLITASSSSSSTSNSLAPPLSVERDVALMSPYIQKEVVQNGLGLPDAPPVPLPKQVTADSWAMVLEYCRFHLVSGRSDKERRMFDERFIRVDTNLLCELTSAADALDMRPLVDLASRAIAKMIEGKSPDQIREAFRLPDDLTEEEKLEPLRTVADDPRIRMLNRLYARKRKELAERKAQLLQAQAQQWQAAQGGSSGGSTRDGAGQAPAAALPAPPPQPQDTRSLDELLSFIEDDGSKAGKGSGSKGKAKKKKAKKAQPAAEGSAMQPTSSPRPAAEAAGAAAGENGGCSPPSLPQEQQQLGQQAFGPAGPLAGAAAASMASMGATSPASTLPNGSVGGVSGRSSLDSSPERLSMHSAHSMLSSTPASPGVDEAGEARASGAAPAAAAEASSDGGSGGSSGSGALPRNMNGGSRLAAAGDIRAAPATAVPVGSALPGALPGAIPLPGALLLRPPFWGVLPAVASPAAAAQLAGLLAEDDVMDYYEDEDTTGGAVDSIVVPVNPFAARTTLLHRPITTLTSLSAFRAPAGQSSGLPDLASPTLGSSRPPSSGGTASAAGAQPSATAAAAAAAAGAAAAGAAGYPGEGTGMQQWGQGEAFLAAGQAAGSSPAAAAPLTASPQQQQRQGEQPASPHQAAPQGAVGLATTQAPAGAPADLQLDSSSSSSSSRSKGGSHGPGSVAAADAEVLAGLISSFLEDLGLQNYLQIVPGAAMAAGVKPDGPEHELRSVGRLARSSALPSGGVVELNWQS